MRRIIEANGDRCFRGNVFELTEHNGERGIDIDITTSLTEWDGMPVDYNHVMHLMFFDVDFSDLPLPESELARYRV